MPESETEGKDFIALISPENKAIIEQLLAYQEAPDTFSIKLIKLILLNEKLYETPIWEEEFQKESIQLLEREVKGEKTNYLDSEIAKIPILELIHSAGEVVYKIAYKDKSPYYAEFFAIFSDQTTHIKALKIKYKFYRKYAEIISVLMKLHI
jgi:hypothetical protein